MSLPRTLPHLTPLGHHRVPCWVPYVMQQLSKEENEKAGLKLTIQKTKIMASSPVTSWQIDGETMETVTDLFFWASKSLQMVIAAMKLKDS